MASLRKIAQAIQNLAPSERSRLMQILGGENVPIPAKRAVDSGSEVCPILEREIGNGVIRIINTQFGDRKIGCSYHQRDPNYGNSSNFVCLLSPGPTPHRTESQRYGECMYEEI